MTNKVDPWTLRNEAQAALIRKQKLIQGFEAYLEAHVASHDDKLAGLVYGHQGYDKPSPKHRTSTHFWITAEGIEGLGVLVEQFDCYPGKWLVKGYELEHLEAFEKMGYMK